MNKEKMHWCSCITIKEKGIIKFKNKCKRHEDNTKIAWIAIQHDK